ECHEDASMRSKLLAMLKSVNATAHDGDPLSDRRIDEQRLRIDEAMESGSRNPLPAFVPGPLLEQGETIDVGSTSGTRIGNANIGAPATFIEGGRYRIVSRIATGGMGAVYKAEQDKPRRIVALKMIHPYRINPSLIERFHREAEILGRLQHPGIAHVHDAGMVELDDGRSSKRFHQPYFAMEFIDGVSLTKFCEQENWSILQRLGLLASVCDAVQYAHEKGVIHRDLKPDNILVDEHGRAKILDFGIAKITESDTDAGDDNETKDGQILGTLAYMAPEQMSGAHAVTPRADVYALGAIGFELLAGRQPHDLSGKTTADSLEWLNHHDPPRLGAVDRSLRGDIETIIGKALDRIPERRYESAAALASDIRRHLAHDPISARPPTRVYAASKFVRRHRTLVGSALTIFVVLLAGIASTTAATMRAQQALSNLEEVASFQEERLAVNPAAVGVVMYNDLIDRFSRSMNDAQLSEDEIEGRIENFRRDVSLVNFTTYAAATIEHNLVDESLLAIDDQFAEQPLVRAQLLRSVAATLRTLGAEKRATDVEREAYAIRREILGEWHPETLRSQLDASMNLEPDEKVHELEIVVQRMRSVLGEDHLETVRAVALYLSTLSKIQIHKEKADLVCEQALALVNRLLPVWHVDRVEATIRCGPNVNSREDRVDVLRAASEAAELELGPRHATTLQHKQKLATLLMAMPDHAEAELVLREILDVKLAAYGEAHPELIQTQHRLGNLLSGINQLEEAEELLQQAADLVAYRDKKHAILIHNLGFVQYKRGKLEEAEANMRRSLELRIMNGYMNTVSCRANLANVLADAGKFDEAEAMAREAVDRRMKKIEKKKALADRELDNGRMRPKGDRHLMRARRSLGRTLLLKGEFQGAERELSESYDVCLATYAAEDDACRGLAGLMVRLYESMDGDDRGADHEDTVLLWQSRAGE
ncbi:MAG: protein kinase domain-containing protein, partial [Phycisphaerae bacterium]